MSLRAVIFDVYKTLLHVGPAPADGDARWEDLVRGALQAEPQRSLAAFKAACDRVIAREHAAARAAGIAHPEIFWPAVVAEVMPELAERSAVERDEFLFRQQAMFHTVSLMPGAGAVLEQLRSGGVRIGVASNAQPYTLRELETALQTAGLGLELFSPELCFWSFAHGFSKPDPHVFRLLAARLRAHGIVPEEALMVGDRLDNDIAPARAQGWRTWQLQVGSVSPAGGGWPELGRFIADRVPGTA